MSANTIPGDRFSPILSLTPAERIAARRCYAADPAPFDVLIRESLRLVDHGDEQAVTLALAAREGLG
jgi:hypothetical protein